MDDNALWKTALGQLELRVSQGNFLTWFQHTRIKERKADKVLVETDSPFCYEWLCKKYRNIILDVLQGLDPSISQVDFCVGQGSRQKKIIGKNLRIIAQKRFQQQAPYSQKEDLSQKTSTGITRETAAKTSVASSAVSFNPKYTFESFIVGPSNEIAHAACQAVASNPGGAYNPLFIYGGVGLGKTHLLQAVANTLIGNNPAIKVVYASSEKFINEFVIAIREKKTHEFKNSYRNIDVFIIDDVQFLAGKGKTQEELFHTFNALHSQNKQVILSSDRPPSSIPTIQERLSSRLAGGMIADVKKPDYETRLAILEEKAELRKASIDAEALDFIARNIQNNVRELEGALNRVIAHCELHNSHADIEYTKKVLSEILDKTHRKTIGINQILQTVSSYYNISTEDLCGKSRKKEIVIPRQIAMYLLRKENSMSFPSIGDHFGGRDHTTAMHACEKVEKLIDKNEELHQELNFLKERLYIES